MAEISTGILKMKEFSDGSSMWRMSCDCLSPAHYCDMSMDFDDDTYDVTVSLDMHQAILLNEYDKNPISIFWKRLKVAFKVIFTGYYETSGSVILKEEAAYNMIAAMDAGIKKIKETNANRG